MSINRSDPTKRQEYFNSPEKGFNLENGYIDRKDGWFDRVETDFALFSEGRKCLLDIGCASGYYTKELSKHFETTVGTDFAETRINHAKQHEKENLKFVLADLTSDEFPEKFDTKFDCMFSTAVFPHIPKDKKVKAFDNLARIAEPSCELFLYDGRSSQDIVDGFVGLFNENWIKDNVGTWIVTSVNHIIGGTYKYRLQRYVDPDLT